jgi:prevent-host-death family protein
MRAVGLKVLKNKLSEYVRLAAGGEAVLVTDRGRVVAEIVPPRAGRGSDVGDAMMAELVRRGLVAPATLPPGEPPAAAPVMTFELLVEDRPPPPYLWRQPLISSRLLAYEVWNRVHARGASRERTASRPVC